MRPMSENLTKLQALFERMKATSETPDFQARLERLLEAERAQAVDDRRSNRRRARIPEAFWATLDAPTETRPLQFVRAWAAGRSQFCIAAGKLGVGKSFALAWAVDQLGGRYVHAVDLARQGYFDDEMLEALIRVRGVLALDELGAEAMDRGGWYESKLLRLLSARFEDGRRTLLGTNLAESEFRARYGSGEMVRLWDRITSSMDAETFDGESLRHLPPPHWTERGDEP